MRASQEDLTGARGQSEVKAEFEEIGWGPIESGSHDLGTDLYIQVRDDRRFDRGMLVGAQVKSGPSYFKDVLRDENGNISGWWYREDKGDHFNYWINHTIPHILILRDLDTKTSYWAHVTSTSVLSTGKGNKILVPATQRIAPEQLDNLIKIAASQKGAPRLEGSVWTSGSASLAPGQRFRYALIASRLVAPHRNAGFEDAINPEEGVALLMQGRVRDLTSFSEHHPSVPSPDIASASDDWGWQFLGALWRWLVGSDAKSLAEVAAEAPDWPRRVAATVAQACSLMDNDSFNEALSILDRLVAEDGAGPVDLAWLLVQRGRIRMELGDDSGAHDDALASAKALVGQGDDVSASAVAASAEWLLWQVLRWPAGKLQEVIAANDTAVSWWRSQKIASALIEGTERTFRGWSDDRSTRFQMEDSLHNGLLSASLTAHLSAEHGNWRASTSLLSKLQLMAAHISHDHDTVERAIDDLRRSGDSSALRLAVRHIGRVGPLSPLGDAVAQVSHTSWTRTTVATDLELWAEAGDLLSEAQATEAVHFCIEAANGTLPASTVAVIKDVGATRRFLNALAGLLPAVGQEGTNAAFTFLIRCLENLDDYRADELPPLVHSLRFDDVAPDDRRELVRRARELSRPKLAAAILGQLADLGETREALAQLLERSKAGDAYALNELGDLRLLDDASAPQLLEAVETAVRKITASARQGAYSRGDFDYPLQLTVMNALFPAIARWEPLLDLLTEPKVSIGDKIRACNRLTALVDRLPQEVVEQLTDSLTAIAATQDLTPSFPGEPHSIQGTVDRLAFALGALDEEAVLRRFARLGFGNWEERRDLARAIGSAPGPFGAAIPVLVADSHADVRAAAATAASRLVATGNGSEVERSVVWHAARSDGRLGPTAVLHGITWSTGTPDGDLDAVLRELSTHPSAEVRLYARRVQLRVSRDPS